MAQFLGEYAQKSHNDGKGCPISLRTLELGVELANVAPDSWHSLLKKSIATVGSLPEDREQVEATTKSVVAHLNESGMKVEDQVREFQLMTGKSRRAFFYARKSVLDKLSSHRAEF